MSKRRINKQQQKRIKEKQTSHQKRINPFKTNQFGQEEIGTIISHYGKVADVLSQGKERFRCTLRQNLGYLVAGDEVTWCRVGEQSGVIVARNERRSVLGRPNKSGAIKPIAANIDQMLIVVSPSPSPSYLLIDSYLVASYILNISPVIVINKVDIESLADLEQLYKKIGYPVLKTSNENKQGLSDLHTILKDKNNVFVGQSGVGKSSLIASFVSDKSINIGQISEKADLGKHTTSRSQYYPLKNGGAIIDSPGIREFDLWHFNTNEITKSFIEFSPYLGFCKFRNCKHLEEPGCALLQAYKQGIIAKSRMTNYQYLIINSSKSR